MATAEQIKDREIRGFCSTFGFNFEADFNSKTKPVPREVVFMHAILSTNSFYPFLQKFGPINLSDHRKLEGIKKFASQFISRLSGGSGELNWQEDKHELIYKILHSMNQEQGKLILLYPQVDQKEMAAHIGDLSKYIPGHIPYLKLIAFIKFIHPEWMRIVEECRAICKQHEELKKEEARYLPWYWGGAVDAKQHAAIIHESIHCILMNSRTDRVLDTDAYREGMDVFFHRKSGLPLGYYQKNIFSSGDLKKYWEASEIFYKEFSDIKNKSMFQQIPAILRNRNDPRTGRICQAMLAKFGREKFHEK